MPRRDVLLWAGSLVLLAVAVVRLTVRDRPPRLRPVSIEAFQVPSDRVDPGQSVVREAHWSPPDDVYVLGWNPWLAGPANVAFDAEMMLYHGETKTTVFILGQRITPPGALDTWRPFSLPPGTGYRLGKGEKLTFRYRVTNTGTSSFDTRGATALIYFLPVEGN